MMSLAAPLLLAYLTYSTVGAGTQLVNQFAQTAPSAVHKKAEADAAHSDTKRNPFDQAATSEMTELLAARLPGLAVAGDAKKEEVQQELRLNGTVIMGGWRMAIINGQRLHEGDEYDGMRLAAIARDKVIFVDRAGRNVFVRLDVAKSDEVEVARTAKQEQGSHRAENRAALQRGMAALTARSQSDLLESLGIPKN
jgi:hypothetical protein